VQTVSLLKDMELSAKQSKVPEKQITQKLTALLSQELVSPGGIGLGFSVTSKIIFHCTPMGTMLPLPLSAQEPVEVVFVRYAIRVPNPDTDRPDQL
jgi:hypothetical protein